MSSSPHLVHPTLMPSTHFNSLLQSPPPSSSAPVLPDPNPLSPQQQLHHHHHQKHRMSLRPGKRLRRPRHTTAMASDLHLLASTHHHHQRSSLNYHQPLSYNPTTPNHINLNNTSSSILDTNISFNTNSLNTITAAESNITTLSSIIAKATPSPSSILTNGQHNHSTINNSTSMQIQISSFTPMSRRAKHDPDLVIVYTCIDENHHDENNHENSKKQKQKQNENKNIHNNLTWRPVASVTYLPAVVALPKVFIPSTQIKLSFHTTKPSRHLGDAICTTYRLSRSKCIVVPIKQKNIITSVIFLRTNFNPHSSSSPYSSLMPSDHTTTCTPERAGVSIAVRIAPSMIRETRLVVAVILSVVSSKHCWPAGRSVLTKRTHRTACISAPADVLWFGMSSTSSSKSTSEKKKSLRPNNNKINNEEIEKEKEGKLKLEWVSAPKKGLTFVHGKIFLQLKDLETYKNSLLLPVRWTEDPTSESEDRSVCVEHISFRDSFWFVDLSLTR